MVATPGVPLIQVPPVFPSVLNWVPDPEQIELRPLIVPALGTAFTVIAYVVEDVPQSLVTL